MPLTGMPTTSLVRRSQSGDRDALEALVVRHQDWVYPTSICRIRSPGRRNRSNAATRWIQPQIFMLESYATYRAS